MANARPGYKRIMGEIPEAMHEKITLYNKISGRPLNVSKAIEICIQQAVKIIDEELIEHADANTGDCWRMIDGKIYEAIKKDIEESDLNPVEIHGHFIKILREKYTLDETFIRFILYPIDKVEYEEPEEIHFYARDTHCFALYPPTTLEKYMGLV